MFGEHLQRLVRAGHADGLDDEGLRIVLWGCPFLVLPEEYRELVELDGFLAEDVRLIRRTGMTS